VFTPWVIVLHCLGSPLHQNQDISNTARRLETALYIPTF
jgi:hypothetical protein